MEIGISTDQMIDVGLNLAGFIAVGLLLMLIKSLFSRKRNAVQVRVQDVPQPITEASEDSISSEQFSSKPDSNIEYVNLGGVDWMNSLGLGVLLGCLVSIRNTGGEMAVSRVQRRVRTLFSLIKACQLFHCFKSITAAVAHLHGEEGFSTTA